MGGKCGGSAQPGGNEWLEILFSKRVTGDFILATSRKWVITIGFGKKESE